MQTQGEGKISKCLWANLASSYPTHIHFHFSCTPTKNQLFFSGFKTQLLSYSHDQLYKHICMQNHSDDTIKTGDTVLLEKYTSHFIWKGCVWEGVGDRTELQHIDPHSYGHRRFFPVHLGCSTVGLGASLSGTCSSIQHLLSNCNCSIGGRRAHSAGCWLSLLHLVSNWSDHQTDWISCALSYIIVQCPPSSGGRHKLHSFNPSTVKVILCYSSTGCTCYLHRCISYIDSPAGS